MRGRVMRLVTQTLSNGTWIAPAGVVRLESASGKGAAGTPSSTYWRMEKYSYYEYYEYANGKRSYSAWDLVDWYETIQGDTPPPDEYGPIVDYGTFSKQEIVHYILSQETSSATTGASATAFGKTFPGGVGGPASTTTFNNIAVTPLQSYPIVVPTGGSITITYYQ
jgi:hypothetical protein